MSSGYADETFNCLDTGSVQTTASIIASVVLPFTTTRSCSPGPPLAA
jgi:hypothetical protein